MERLTRTFSLEGELKTSDLFRLLQDIAADDAALRGGGREELLRHGCTWVLVKNRLEISRWPAPGEALQLSTWPVQGRFALYPRNFELKGAAGELLLRVESIWAMMDLESRTMILGEERGIRLLGVEEARFRPSRRIAVPDGGAVCSLQPKPEQIDANGHMNNAAYLDAVEPMLPEDLQGKRPFTIAIDYEHELLPGYRAQVRAVREGNSCFFEGIMEDKVCFRLREDF